MNKFLPLLLLILFVWADYSSIVAQPIRNLNFEEVGLINPNAPVGWASRNLGQEISIDSVIVHSGKVSLRSKNESDEGGFFIINQSIPNDLISGKHVKLSGWIRTENITEGHANLWIRVDGYQNGDPIMLAIDNMVNELAVGSLPWTKYSVELNVEEEAISTSFGALHQGNGIAWFDNLEITIDGVIYDPDLYEPWSATPKEIDWLKNNIKPLTSDEPGNDFDDLAELESFFKDVKIVGLGEATHGTREFFRMKHRFIEWFASQSDTTIFVIEAGMPEARIVNEYVLHGIGDPKEALAGMHFWVWNTQEVLDLIEWICAYNESGNGRIEFLGNDLQFPHLAADSVRAFVAKADPGFSTSLNDHYKLINGPDELRVMDHEQLMGIHESVSKVKDHLEQNRENYLRHFELMDVEWAIQNARIIEQSVSRFLFGEDSRDKSMAINTEWIYNHWGQDSKIIIWAHNDHVGYNEYWMGKYLNESFGEQYRSVGFAFGEGKYSAVLSPNTPVEYFPLAPPRNGSVEYVFQKIDIPIFAVNLLEAKIHPDGKWLSSPKPLRSIGSTARDEPYREIPVAEYFDLMIYFDKTSASHSFGRPKNN